MESFTDTVNDPEVAVQGEILVKYKEGQSPEELQQRQQQAQQEGQTVMGAMSNTVSALANRVTGEETVEAKVARIETVAQTVGVEETQPIISPQLLNDESLRAAVAQTQVVTASEDTSVTQLLYAYGNLPEVEYVQPNYRYYPTLVPNDTFYTRYQWNMKKIGMEEVWDRQPGSTNVIVAVIDSGIDANNPDLVGKITPGRNFSPGEDPNDLMDYQGHGTMTASIIGAAVNNNYAIAGMNRDVQILNIKIFGSSGLGATDAELQQGIMLAIDRQAKVINFSGGATDIPCSQMPGFQDAVNQATARGILFVQAAGNDNSGFADGCANVIEVGATTIHDLRAPYSDWGSDVDISAPGGDSSCDECYVSAIGLNNQVYGTAGTSFADPHVSGAAALLWAQKANMTVEEMTNLLIQTADPITTDAPIGPRLNVVKALQAIAPYPTLTPTPVSQTPTATPVPSVTTGPTISVAPTVTTAPSTTPGVTVTVTPTTAPAQPTVTIAPTNTPMPSPTPVTPPSQLALMISLPGITARAPAHAQQKAVTVELSNASGLVLRKTGMLNYIPQTGYFTGRLDLGQMTPGGYLMKIKMDGYLIKLVPNLVDIQAHQTATPPLITLRAGDVTNDNVINIQDYNGLFNCFGSKYLTSSCQFKQTADLNNDGMVDGIDLNIFLKTLSEQSGE